MSGCVPRQLSATRGWSDQLFCSPDAALIVAQGTRGPGSRGEAQYAVAPAVWEAETANAEDARIISLINARRAQARQNRYERTAAQRETRSGRRRDPREIWATDRPGGTEEHLRKHSKRP